MRLWLPQVPLLASVLQAASARGIRAVIASVLQAAS